ncbi:hypothetical protein [Photorhabdus australis]
MLPGIRSLAVAMHLEIYWVYLIFYNTKNIFKLLLQLLTGNSNAPN